jgi:hypothetical protein
MESLNKVKEYQDIIDNFEVKEKQDVLKAVDQIHTWFYEDEALFAKDLLDKLESYNEDESL